MAIKWEIRRAASIAQGHQMLNERVFEGLPTIVFDRGTKSHPSEITGLQALPKERAEEVAFIDLTNTAKRSYSLHVLDPSTLASDLAFLSRTIETWLLSEHERQRVSLKGLTGQIDKKISVLDFLLSVYFEEQPNTAEKAVGGPEGIKEWRLFLRSLGQGLSSLIFEDPWFTFLFLSGGDSAVPANAPLVLVPLFTPLVPRHIAMRSFEIVLDRAAMLRINDSEEEELHVFLSDAEDLVPAVATMLSRLSVFHEKTSSNLNIVVWPISTKGIHEHSASDLVEAFYTLSQLKYGRDEDIAKKGFKLESWPKEIKNLDFFGPLHNLMYSFPEFSSISDSNEIPTAIAALKKEGFLLGAASPPIEFPEDI